MEHMSRIERAIVIRYKMRSNRPSHARRLLFVVEELCKSAVIKCYDKKQNQNSK